MKPDDSILANLDAGEVILDEHRTNEKQAEEALLGYAKFPLFGHNSVSLHFGRWNTRPVAPDMVRKLKESMQKQGVRWWAFPMPIAIKREWIDIGELAMTQDAGTNLPLLVLTKAGRDQVMEGLGGRHRRSAVKSLMHDAQEELTKLERKIERADNVEKAVELMSQKDKLQEELDGLQYWGGQFYDIGEQQILLNLVNLILTLLLDKVTASEPLAEFLSRNEDLPKMKETVEEGLVLDYVKLLEAQKKDRELRAASQVNFTKVLDDILMRHPSSDRKHILFRRPVIRNFLLTTYGLPYFRSFKMLKVGWMREHLIKVHGNVST